MAGKTHKEQQRERALTAIDEVGERIDRLERALKKTRSQKHRDELQSQIDNLLNIDFDFHHQTFLRNLREGK